MEFQLYDREVEPEVTEVTSEPTIFGEWEDKINAGFILNIGIVGEQNSAKSSLSQIISQKYDPRFRPATNIFNASDGFLVSIDDVMQRGYEKLHGMFIVHDDVGKDLLVREFQRPEHKGMMKVSQIIRDAGVHQEYCTPDKDFFEKFIRILCNYVIDVTYDMHVLVDTNSGNVVDSNPYYRLHPAKDGSTTWQRVAKVSRRKNWEASQDRYRRRYGDWKKVEAFSFKPIPHFCGMHKIWDIGQCEVCRWAEWWNEYYTLVKRPNVMDTVHVEANLARGRIRDAVKAQEKVENRVGVNN